MNLTDVEKAVIELSSRHPDLTKEFLRTLLEASGWEAKNIKEAEMLFLGRFGSNSTNGSAQNLPDLHPNEYKREASAEQSLHSDSVSSASVDSFEAFHPKVVDEPLKNQPADDGNTDISMNTRDSITVTKHEEQETVRKTSNESLLFKESRQVPTDRPQESLIKDRETPLNRDTKKLALPDNLPLVPFESSPHVWSFGRYKDTFHPEQPPVDSEQSGQNEQVSRVVSQVTYKTKAQPQIVAATEVVAPQVVVSSRLDATPKATPPEADFEKTPITIGDESLVVLAAVMLLAIMLILGYMYSNGRL